MTGVHSSHLSTFSDVIGWAYFAAWSVSFYPQVWVNYKRRSVVGLHFDYVSLNLTGFFFYAIYNVALYASPVLKRQYFEEFEESSEPVKINDVVFATHALALTVVIVVQILIYERGGQQVSAVAKVILWAMWTSVGVVAVLCGAQVVSFIWLVNYFSYIKMAVTFIKYVPQAWFNFRRKSTKGWSIGNILLDFTGGTLSLLQMTVDSVNQGSAEVFTGNFAKTALAFFSVFFDVVFMVQHYVLYPGRAHPDDFDPTSNAVVKDTDDAAAGNAGNGLANNNAIDGGDGDGDGDANVHRRRTHDVDDVVTPSLRDIEAATSTNSSTDSPSPPSSSASNVDDDGERRALLLARNSGGGYLSRQYE